MEIKKIKMDKNIKAGFAVKLVFEELIWKNNKPGFIFENVQTQNLK